MGINNEIKLFFTWLTSVYLLSVGTGVQAAEMALSKSPLFLGTQIDPNIFFMLDDSGSMDWEILTQRHHYYNDYWTSSGTPFGEVDTGLFRAVTSTGGCSSSSARFFAYIFSNTDDLYSSCSSQAVVEGSNAAVRDWRVRNANFNIMYYNPSATYSPWNGYANASFTAARSNPVVGSDGYSSTKNLTGFQYDVWIDDHSFTGATVKGRTNVADGPNDLVDLYDSHTTYTVNATTVTKLDRITRNANWIKTSGASTCSLTDANATPQYAACFGTQDTTTTISGGSTDQWGRTAADIQQNVANWYQYHRRRSFAAKAAISQVVSSSTTFRFGISLLNDYNTLFVNVPGALIKEYDAHNTALLNSMNQYKWRALGTPLRQGLEVVGRYYSNYYSATKPNPIISACQQNYTVLFTDGYWSTGNLLTNAIGDEDLDGINDTLADVAKYFYKTDLSPLPNDVPTSPIDPNSAQHMVTFTVAFGVDGHLVDTDNDRYPNPVLKENDVWGANPFNDDSAKIDDLWHAAFNSKAHYVSAQSAIGVANAISNALLEIADRVGSAASVATNTGSLNAGSHLFQARFDSADWKGQLLAFKINLDGTINGNPVWEAGQRLNTQNYDTGRKIITWNPNVDNPTGGVVEGDGIKFRFPANYQAPDATTEMNSTQVAALLTRAPYPVNTVVAAEIAANQNYGRDLLNYLRGDKANDGVGRGFRNRNSVLGDIVNSDPKFVSYPNSRYPSNLEAASYANFVTANANRPGMVYVGANDGMLHAFSESSGNEMLAYVPGAVIKNLWELADPQYKHRYFVDAGPNIVDMYFPGIGVNGAWKTVLAGGLNGGGQAVYALDVTNPAQFDEATAASLVLWEFDDSDDPDLGFTYGKPQLAKMANGKWVAIFGNGYNNTAADGSASSTGYASLFIVDIEKGTLIKKISTNVGSVGTPNGLATPLLIDRNGDYIVDYIYAGDMRGNMWKFDVTSNMVADWKVAYSSGGNPIPLFTTDSGQPITSQPQAALHPDNLPGFMIYFGTGKYLEINDNDPLSQPTQTFYGIWDKNEANLTVFNSSKLVTQSISNQYQKMFDTNADGIPDKNYELRDVSKNKIDFTKDMGWKLDLKPVKLEGEANVNNFGEKQVTNAILRNGRIIFTTLVPSSVECKFGGKSFLMELDFRSGGALGSPTFDLNGDGEYDADDTDASGRASDVGIMPTVSLLANGAQDVAFGSSASGNIDVIRLSVGSDAYGRQSWREIR